MEDTEKHREYWMSFAGRGSDVDDYTSLATASRPINLQAGENLVTQADASNTVFLVVSGKLKAVRYSQNGHEIWLSSFGPSSLIGEMSGLTGSKRTSTVICVSPALLVAVDYSDFEHAMLSIPAFSLAVSKVLAQRVHSTSTQLEELATLQTSARLHSELIRLGTLDTRDDEVLSISNPPTVSELAIRIHAARESTSRALSFLEKRGFLMKKMDGSLQVISPKNFG